MERRTTPGYEYHSRDFMEDGIFIDMNRLREYEDTDLTPEQVMELKDRDMAKEPTKDYDSGVMYTDDYICPNCGKHFTGTGIAEFCYHCGQRLKWEEW